MDIDISDILADVSRPAPSRPSTHHSRSEGPPTPYLPDNSTYTDHQLLTRAWTAERCTTELLPYPTQLMERVMERVAGQIARIEELAAGGSSDYATGGAGGAGGGANINLVLSILQTDLSRTQFLVRSLLRARLAKVGKWAGYYGHVLEQQQQSSGRDEDESVLSGAEAQFLSRHQALLMNFYEGSFLAGFPPKMRRLDDGGTGEGGMLEGPGREGVVVVRCLAEGGWGNEDSLGRRRDDEGIVNEVRLRRGDVQVVRWGDVRGGVVDGALEVL
ncbi:DNA replication complex GINS protein SLD5 [Cyphellophora attinorum]|uniref:DNA replication complex GINS protein SLD5 n=1 Tax=Cyphellophora attinorum TaxID=1664694 RepID=A0A0N1P2D6_9EURO|nr:DNA replication complex GINS protein SLD5 [Phialophora attinorum]KPI45673.1 DNA replication complex GINS protein SLD5 [Phialophora attinorum]